MRAPADRGPADRSSADRGSATVWAAGAVAVVLVIAVVGMHLGGVLLARHRAESAADLAALAAAGRSVAGGRWRVRGPEGWRSG